MNYQAVVLSLVAFSQLISAHQTIHSPFFSFEIEQQTAHVFYIPHPSQTKNGNSLFFNACFDFPFILEHAHHTNVPLILAIPDTYQTISTIEEDAPIIEGARVALAWASAYQRFDTLGNINVCALLIPKTYTEQQILQNISELVTKEEYSIPFTLTPEEKMAQRITRAYLFQQAPLSNAFCIKPIESRPKTPETKIITPKSHTKKTILITGVAGFLGSYLAQTFLDKNYYVIGLDNFICSTGENLIPLKKQAHFEFHEFDVSHPFEIEGPIDYIAHLASVPSPADYYKMPVETLRSGLHGARQALALAARKNARILLASSSEVYGNPEMHPQPETYAGRVDPIAMRSQYDESKRGEETLAKIYYEKHGIDIRIARIFNTFGPGMRLSDGRVMTNFIQAALDNKPMIVHGDGNQTRSPAFVTDTIDGLTKLLESDTISHFQSIDQRIFNVGTPIEFSVNQIADAVNTISQKHLNYTVPITHIPHFDTTDPKVRRPDITYLKKIIGFQPRISFEEGIEKMFVHYMKKHKKNKS